MTIYEGEILQEGNVAENLSKEISKKNELVVLKHGGTPYKVVIGVPHHANIGESHICEESPEGKRDSDENAASYATVAYNDFKEKGIPAKLVIMAHATGKDPNKYKESPYFHEIFNEKAEILFECHGAGGKRRLDIEVSAGQNRLSKTIEIGRTLAHYLEKRYSIGIQKEPGKVDALVVNRDGIESDGILEMPANKTKSLKEAEKEGVAALHLEAKPQFRIPEHGKHISDDGIILGEAIAGAIIHYNRAIDRLI